MMVKADCKFEHPPAIVAWPNPGRGEQKPCEPGASKASWA